MGGGISLRFAGDFPERTSSMTLIGSVGPVVEKSETVLALDRGENPLLLQSTQDLDLADGAHLGEDAQVAAGDEDLHRPGSASRPPRRARPPSSAAGTGRRTARGSTPNRKVGAHAPRSSSTARATRHSPLDRPRAGCPPPNARLEMLEGIGHMIPQMEAPRRVARMVDAFIDDVEGRRLS